MARNMSKNEVERFLDAVDSTALLAREVQKAFTTTRLDDMGSEFAMGAARNVFCATRDLQQAGIHLLSRFSLEQQREAINKMQEERKTLEKK